MISHLSQNEELPGFSLCSKMTR